jgi:hypothetical protein
VGLSRRSQRQRRINHKQTFRQEFNGKYIWSPKRNRNGQINPFYETIREVARGDIVYSFAAGARGVCSTSPKALTNNRIIELV